MKATLFSYQASIKIFIRRSRKAGFFAPRQPFFTAQRKLLSKLVFMKWLFLFLSPLSLLSVQTSFCQQWTGSTATTGLLYRDGNVLVGDNTFRLNISPGERAIELIGTNTVFDMRSNNASGNFTFAFYPQFNSSSIISSIPLNLRVGNIQTMTLPGNGNVLIGKTTQTNTAYMLDVNGRIRANKVVVNTTGADFVFESGYHLPSLKSVEQFIKTHHHLPGIAPAQQMQKEGVDLGDNQTKLLQKIEELTLYIIEQQKQIRALQEENKKITNLQSQIDRLAARLHD